MTVALIPSSKPRRECRPRSSCRCRRCDSAPCRPTSRRRPARGHQPRQPPRAAQPGVCHSGDVEGQRAESIPAKRATEHFLAPAGRCPPEERRYRRRQLIDYKRFAVAAIAAGSPVHARDPGKFLGRRAAVPRRDADRLVGLIYAGRLRWAHGSVRLLYEHRIKPSRAGAGGARTSSERTSELGSPLPRASCYRWRLCTFAPASSCRTQNQRDKDGSEKSESQLQETIDLQKRALLI